MVNIDLGGLYSTPSMSGAKYFLTLVDDFLRATWIFLIHNKTNVFKVLQNFCALVQTQFSKVIKTVKINNGTEFVNQY